MKLHNQAVVKSADTEPHEEVTDIDIHSCVGSAVRRKRPEVEWIPGHRTESHTM